MDITLFNNIDPNTMEWVVIPLLIFIARVIDVALSTIRIILIIHDRKKFATVLSFFEILIWLIAITQILQNLTNVMCYIAFAGGFSTGTYVGMLLEKKLSMGIVLIRTITTQKDASSLVKYFKENNFRFTSVNAEGSYGKVNVVYTVINQKEMKKVIEIIRKFNPNAFYTIENIKYVNKPEGLINAEPDNKLMNFMKRIKIK